MIKNDNMVAEAQGYDAADLLASRTDGRGVILAANDAFQRVSGYEWKDLKNAPHKVLRHSDMPKGMFWLIWENLKNKKSVGGFIKNRSKNGSYYWVFAFMVPQGDGFLSVRMKPTADAVKTISEEYAALLKAEEEEGLTPEQSGMRLIARVRELGFRNYDHFIVASASEQLRARNKELRRSDAEHLDKLVKISDEWSKVSAQCDQLKEAHEQISHTPTNLRVQAAHLNDRGIALSVIASNFTILESEIEGMLSIVMTQDAAVEEQLNQTAFNTCLETLMPDVVNSLEQESSNMAGGDWGAETAKSNLQRQSLLDRGTQSLTVALQEIDSFSNQLEEAARIMSGLSVAKVMCEIENAYVSADSSSGVTGIIGELAEFQEEAQGCLFDIRLNLTQIAQSIRNVQSDLGTRSEKSGSHSVAASRRSVA